jgi:serine/threonine protein kinase
VGRFEREAKVLAALNHPNIGAIYELESTADTTFLVLELVEGETLADRIKQGPLPVKEALPLALQIADAIDAAHEKDVVHRDLKPANIKVTPDGKVKVLDFGLAKALATDQDLANSPTLSMAATAQGVILGTAAYMSPEQARGQQVDRRTDVWAFGCVLFEMLAGRPAFRGDTVSDVLASVLAREPEFVELPATLPPRLREALQRCLEKNPKRRCLPRSARPWRPRCPTLPQRHFWQAAARGSSSLRRRRSRDRSSGSNTAFRRVSPIGAQADRSLPCRQTGATSPTTPAAACTCDRWTRSNPVSSPEPSRPRRHRSSRQTANGWPIGPVTDSCRRFP